MLFPYGLEDARISRIPWASIGIVSLILVGFFASGPGDASDAEVARQAIALHALLATYPEVEMPEGCVGLIKRPAPSPNSPSLQALLGLPSAPKPELADPKGAIEASCTALLGAMAQGWRRWALVPARGAMQPGWLTALFLHAGFWHLAGNLFFFVLLVGPFLEDVWGWKVFLGFYLAGGLVAGIAQALLSRDSPVPILGASGAIAACMGAFSLRFSKRKVKFFYWVGIVVRGTFSLPAWVYGVFWVGSEIFNLLFFGDGAGIAFMAHIGGFGFGLGFAVLLRGLDLEQRYIKPMVDAEDGVWEQDAGVTTGLDALARGDRDAARAAFLAVIAKDPTSADAHLNLARMDFDEGDAAAGSRRIDGVFSRWLVQKKGASIQAVIDELGDHLDPVHLRPALCMQLARLELSSERTLTAFAFLRAAAASKTPLSLPVGVQAAELAVGPLRERALGRSLALDAIETLEGLPGGGDPALRARAETILRATGGLPDLTAPAAAGAVATVGVAAPPIASSAPAGTPATTTADPPGPATNAAPGASPPSSQPPASRAPPATGAPGIRPLATFCRPIGLRDEGILLQPRGGDPFLLPWGEIVSVQVGMLLRGPDSPEGQPAPIADLLLAGGGPLPRVYRLCDPELSFGALLTPKVSERDGQRVFFATLLDRSGAHARPDRAAVVGGPWPRFEDLGHFERSNSFG